MNIIIDKDGNLYVNDFENNEERLAACIVDPADGDTIVFSKAKGMWEAGQFPSIPPTVFVVTDSSGTLDKKYSEIYEASQTNIVALKDVSGEYATFTYLGGIGNDSGLKLTFGEATYTATAEDAYPILSE